MKKIHLVLAFVSILSTAAQVKMAGLTVILMVGMALPAAAQYTLWGEVGKHRDRYGNGVTTEELVYGFGFQGAVEGTNGPNFGFYVPLGLELRFTEKGSLQDALGTTDLAFRIKNFSFGPGVGFGFFGRGGYVEDSTCLTEPFSTGSSCGIDEERGKRDIGSLFGLGLSGFGKVVYGPSGRFFIQAKYVYFHPSLVSNLDEGKQLALLGGQTLSPVTDHPALRTGNDTRVSAGVILGGLGSDDIKYILRGQYLDRTLNFTREKANLTGVFDQRRQEVSIGIALAF